MSRTVTIAAVRLNNEPAPTPARLQTAEASVIRAAEQGAQVVILPEVFNTGYTYSSDNYTRTEPVDGPTVSWMKRLAAEHNIHLAGSLMLLGPEHITNSLILAAPDGRLWRYDKTFPWVWERLYFREGRDITIAKTDLGTFGLMICADVMTPHLFQRYAGKVDALIICSSPPRMHEAVVRFPDGEQLMLGAMLGLSPAAFEAADQAFGAQLRRYTAWMGVPFANVTPYGQFSTHIPLPWLSLSILLIRYPALWRYIPQHKHVVVSGDYFSETQIIDASGAVWARYDEEADGFALATIELADTPPQPTGKPPRANVLPPNSYDWLLTPFYRRGVRAAWGRHMAPVDRQTRTWLRLVTGALIGGYAFGRLDALRRRR
jgi:predicted amidohydrolase